MRPLAFCLALVLGYVPSTYTAQDKPPAKLSRQVHDAVGLVYGQQFSGSMQMHCTATAFAKTSNSYRFASAAHCIGSDDTQHERSAPTRDVITYISFDQAGVKTFYPAQIVAVGYQSRGDDFLVLDVVANGADRSTAAWSLVPLGDETKIDVGDEDSTKIINVAAPLGLGKQVFTGKVTLVSIDRPLVEGTINWKGAMLLQIQVGGGSSGSAIVGIEQKAIVGFLVGTVGGNNTVAIPVSRFKTFLAAIEAGTYKWFKPEEP